MLWLDSSYPLDKDPSEPGVARGSCATDSGKPDAVRQSAKNAKVSSLSSLDAVSRYPGSTANSEQVTFSNIKFGPIGSTY